MRRLHALMLRHRWEVFFITQRAHTAGDSVQRQTQRWLVEQGFDLPSVLVLGGSRGAAASALGLTYHVDDSAQNCVDIVSDSRAKPILIVPDNDATTIASARRLGIGTARSLSDCLDVLEQATSARTPPGVLERITALVGWSTKQPRASPSPRTRARSFRTGQREASPCPPCTSNSPNTIGRRVNGGNGRRPTPAGLRGRAPRRRTRGAWEVPLQIETEQGVRLLHQSARVSLEAGNLDAAEKSAVEAMVYDWNCEQAYELTSAEWVLERSLRGRAHHAMLSAKCRGIECDGN